VQFAVLILAPWQWIPYLPTYARSPLDKYKQPMDDGAERCARAWERIAAEEQQATETQRH
jgi:hypothetical protein